jgi:hypothetical protein
MLDYPIWSMLLALIACNTYGSYLILADQTVAKSQKSMQMALVWMLPLLGAAVLLFVKEMRYDEFERDLPE